MGLIADIHKDLERGVVKLIVEYRGRLRSEAVGLCKDEALAEDLVFRTFERVLAKIDTYREDTNLFGWMCSIMRNIHRNDLRRPVDRRTVLADADELERCVGADWSTDEQILRNSDSEAIHKALSELDPKYHQVLLMRYYSEFSLKQIADLLRLPRTTVAWRLHVAHELLAGKLSVVLGKTKKPLAVLAAALTLVSAATAAVATVPALAPVRNAITGWLAGGTDGDDRGTGVPPVQVTGALSSLEPNSETKQDVQLQVTQEKETQNMNLPKVITAAALAVSAVAQNANAAGGVDLTLDRVQQRYPWNGFVDIDYTITRDTDALPDVDDNLEVLMIDKSVTPAVTNRAIRFLQAPLPLTAGKHRITWDANGDGVTNYSDKASFIVKIAHYAPAYMVIDVSKGKDAPVYPVTFLNGEPTGGFNTPEYKGDKIVLRRIHPGSYMAGSPTDEANHDEEWGERQHRVALTKPFYIGVFEITQKQYENIMGENPSMYAGPDRPVDTICYQTLRGTPNYNTHQYMWPWTDEVAPTSFMGILCAKCKAFSPDTNDYTEEVTGFDLPLEFQWEYACRAGITGAFSTTDAYENTDAGQKAAMASLGRHGGNRNDKHGDYSDAHTNVGKYEPNRWGLYDMHGNVAEMCRDLSDNDHDPTTLEQYVDPEGGRQNPANCVTRGGCHFNAHKSCRSASRGSTDTRRDTVGGGGGFRLSRTLP